MANKILVLFISTVFFSTLTWAGQKTSSPQKVQSHNHTTIYTAKIKTLVKAINIGQFENEKDYQEMLKVACERNKCNSAEMEAIKIIGREFVHCQLSHLKSHGVQNSDAVNICESKQAIFACDSLATPLLRKMCYHSNNYSLQVLQEKESKMNNRSPASVKSK